MAPRSPGRDHLILSHGAYTYQRAVRTGTHLYIRTLHPGCWRLDPEQLYAIDRDPQMTTDLLASSAIGGLNAESPADPATVGADLAGLLGQWREKHLTLRDPQPDPMEACRYESPAEAFHAPSYETAFGPHRTTAPCRGPKSSSPVGLGDPGPLVTINASQVDTSKPRTCMRRIP